MLELVISSKLTEQKRFIKLQDVILDECITLKNHIRTFKNKIVKSIDYYTETNNYSIKVLLKVFIIHIFIHILTTQTMPGKLHTHIKI